MNLTAKFEYQNRLKKFIGTKMDLVTKFSGQKLYIPFVFSNFYERRRWRSS